MVHKNTISALVRLARLDRPIGIYLLLWPCWWAIALASPQFTFQTWRLYILFAAGAVCMRSAGCVLNDIVDRKLDAKVERTRLRPLASGELQLRHAIGLISIFLLISLVIAMALGPAVILWSALALIPASLYPFMKRISWWPQLFLGFAFNWGALLGWVAVRGALNWPALLLYLAGIFWTLGYDTIYALQDIKDDEQAGIKSTARKFGARAKPFIFTCYVLCIICLLILGMIAGLKIEYFFFCGVTFIFFCIQISRIDLNNSTSFQKQFKANGWVGLSLFLAFLYR